MSGICGYEPLHRDRREQLDQLRTGDGRALLNYIKAQIGRELERLELLLKQVKIVEAERDALLAAAPDKATPAAAAMLLDIKGVGPEFAGVLWSEGLFRGFDNRRQVAAYDGLAPTPWQSGTIDRQSFFACPDKRDSAGSGFSSAVEYETSLFYDVGRSGISRHETVNRARYRRLSFVVRWCLVPRRSL